MFPIFINWVPNSFILGTSESKFIFNFISKWLWENVEVFLWILALSPQTFLFLNYENIIFYH